MGRKPKSKVQSTHPGNHVTVHKGATHAGKHKAAHHKRKKG